MKVRRGNRLKSNWRKRDTAIGLANAPQINLDELDLGEESWTEAVYSHEDNDTLKEVAEQTTYGAIFLDDLLKRQRALSISVAVVFLIIIFSLPLLNFFTRDWPPLQILGIDISWMVLAILIYPVIWALAFYFVSTADKYEDDFTDLVN